VTTTVLNVPRRDQPNWFTCFILAVLHVGAFAALFCFSWRAFILTAILYWITVGFGISLGYHRLHTHRSYKVPLALEYFFALCGALTLEGGPLFWVGTHRLHHAYSDQPGDPHSPRDGAFWAHMGWILFGETNHNNTALMAKYCPDLAKHRFYVWLNSYHWLPTVILTAILFAFGGLPLVLWAVCLRVVVGLHTTWCINSATHIFGSRRFNTTDTSRNTWWVSWATFGEGWHNNHHAHPTSARHGLVWYELDISWITICLMKMLGIAKHVRVARITTPMVEQEAA